jgi:hypothetical protein
VSTGLWLVGFGGVGVAGWGGGPGPLGRVGTEAVWPGVLVYWWRGLGVCGASALPLFLRLLSCNVPLLPSLMSGCLMSLDAECSVKTM